jgi:hypothetical protein
LLFIVVWQMDIGVSDPSQETDARIHRFHPKGVLVKFDLDSFSSPGALLG